jgi:hypothetical protein
MVKPASTLKIKTTPIFRVPRKHNKYYCDRGNPATRMSAMKILQLFRLAKLLQMAPAAAVAILIMFFATPVCATTANAQSFIYFDSQNNIIGQQIIDCHNWTAHAGNTDPSNPYKIEEIWHCYTALDVQCTSGAGPAPPTCTVLGDPGPSHEAYYFLSATGATYSDYCAAGPGDGFNGHPTCGELQPVYFLGTFLPGWN